MKLSKTSTQAILALSFLAEQTAEQFIQARQVAAHLSVPTDSALKILQALARQDLVQSQLGRSGGYRLSRPADQISIAAVVEAVDGSIHNRMRLPVAGEGLGSELLFLQNLCDRGADALRGLLEQTTVADLYRARVGEELVGA